MPYIRYQRYEKTKRHQKYIENIKRNIKKHKTKGEDNVTVITLKIQKTNSIQSGKL